MVATNNVSFPPGGENQRRLDYRLSKWRVIYFYKTRMYQPMLGVVKGRRGTLLAVPNFDNHYIYMFCVECVPNIREIL